MLPYYVTGKSLLIMPFTHREPLQTLSVFTHKIARIFLHCMKNRVGYEEATPKETMQTHTKFHYSKPR